MVNGPLELDDRWFQILASNDYVTLTKHRISGAFDIWLLGEWSRTFVDPNNSFKSEPTEQQAWQTYLELTGAII